MWVDVAGPVEVFLAVGGWPCVLAVYFVQIVEGWVVACGGDDGDSAASVGAAADEDVGVFFVEIVVYEEEEGVGVFWEGTDGDVEVGVVVYLWGDDGVWGWAGADADAFCGSLEADVGGGG